MTNQEVFETAIRQSAVDLNCDPADLGLAACSADCDTMWQIGVEKQRFCGSNKRYLRRGEK